MVVGSMAQPPRLPLYVSAALVGVLLAGVGFIGWNYATALSSCSSTCHSATPQYAAYQTSSHANITCTECHVDRDGAAAFLGRDVSSIVHTVSRGNLVTLNTTVPVSKDTTKVRHIDTVYLYRGPSTSLLLPGDDYTDGSIWEERTDDPDEFVADDVTSFNSVGAVPVGGEGAETRSVSFLYFSVVTLTTVGFGDITAVHPVARSLVMVEALVGTLYPAILLARLVALQIETRRRKHRPSDGDV